ncbi:MAG: hypothetical protein U1A06_17120 [Hoeflea sp.]|nr:hypothetical protein [Hoeflea sp.]
MRQSPETGPMAAGGPGFLALGDNPAFLAVLRDAAQHLLAMHDSAPRVVRYLASMQKWLITQAIIALHFERAGDATRPPLTGTSLVGFFGYHQPFSKNTLIAHLAEMRAYGLLVDVAGGDRRSRPLRLSTGSEELIGQWLEAHLSALDRLDGGCRAACMARDKRLAGIIQPLAARSLAFDPRWVHPPPSVDLFVRTETGSNILHDLICRLPAGPPGPGQPVCLGQVHASEISTRHTLSRGHVQRMFARARTEGLLVWGLAGNRGDLFVSPELVRDYCLWQSLKFEAIARAFDQAQARLEAGTVAALVHAG